MIPNAFWNVGCIDPYYDKVVLLLDTGGADGGTTFADVSYNGVTLTANGNAQNDTAQSKYSGVSGVFDRYFHYISARDQAGWEF